MQDSNQNLALCCFLTFLPNPAKRRKPLHLPAILFSTNALLPAQPSSSLSLPIHFSLAPSVHPPKLPTCNFIIRLTRAMPHVSHHHLAWWIPDTCRLGSLLFNKYLYTSSECESSPFRCDWKAGLETEQHTRRTFTNNDYRLNGALWMVGFSSWHWKD